MTNLIQIQLKDKTIEIPTNNLPIFDFSLADDQFNKNIYKMNLRVSKITNDDALQPFKYDYLKEYWEQIKNINTDDIDKIVIIQNNNIIYNFTNIKMITYKIDFLDSQLGESLEFSISK